MRVLVLQDERVAALATETKRLDDGRFSGGVFERKCLENASCMTKSTRCEDSEGASRSARH